MSAQPTSRAFEIFARVGYAARGLVYCLVALLALLAAFGKGDGVRGTSGALQTLLGKPFGEAVLVFLAVGLVGFAIWRFMQAVFDPDQDGTSWGALVTRVGYFIGAIIYFGLAGTTLSLAFGWGTGLESGERAAQDWTAWLLIQPLGRWITGAVAIGMVGAGVAFAIESWIGNVGEHLRVYERKAWVLLLGRVGYAASAIVFVIVGVFLLLAAIYHNPAEARGLGGALATVEAQPYGSALLAIVAAGLFAFGLFGVVQGIYRRIEAPSLHDAEAAISRAATRTAQISR